MMGCRQILLTGALFAVTNVFGCPHQKVRLLFIGNLILITRPELSTLWRTEPELGILTRRMLFKLLLVLGFWPIQMSHVCFNILMKPDNKKYPQLALIIGKKSLLLDKFSKRNKYSS